MVVLIANIIILCFVVHFYPIQRADGRIEHVGDGIDIADGTHSRTLSNIMYITTIYYQLLPEAWCNEDKTKADYRYYIHVNAENRNV